MSQQEAPLDSGTPLRKVARADAIRAGGADTFRASGFHSPELDTTGNQPAAAPSPDAAATVAAPQPTPGVLAAQQAGPHSHGLNTGNLMWGIHNPFSKGASPIQDIAAFIQQGGTPTDAQWAQAGFGAGGAALSPSPAPAASPMQASLRGVINTGYRVQPTLALMSGLRSI